LYTYLSTPGNSCKNSLEIIPAAIFFFVLKKNIRGFYLRAAKAKNKPSLKIFTTKELYLRDKIDL